MIDWLLGGLGNIYVDVGFAGGCGVEVVPVRPLGGFRLCWGLEVELLVNCFNGCLCTEFWILVDLRLAA